MSFFSALTAANSQTTLIGKTGTFEALGTVQLSDPTLGTFIDDGQIIAIDADSGAVVAAGTTIADHPRIQLVQRSGANAATCSLKYSGVIDGQAVYNFKGQSYAAGQEQIHVIGYNGTSGSIDTTATSRFMNIGYKFDDTLWSAQQNRKVYFTDGSTQVKIASDITVLMNNDSLNALMGSSTSSGFISAERLTDSTTTADASTATVVKGSSQVTVTVANASVGEYIRLGTAVTGPVYLITNIAGLVYTLDTPFQGASAAGVNVDRITAANAATGNWGVKMTGLALTFSLFPAQDVPLMKTAWDTFIPGWGTTTLTKTQEMTFGNGAYEQVAQYALMSAFFSGAQFQYDVPIIAPSNDAVSGDTYSGIYIDHADISDTTHIISGIKPSRRQEYVFLKVSAAQTAILLGQLNPWMASTPRSFPTVGPLA